MGFTVSLSADNPLLIVGDSIEFWGWAGIPGGLYDQMNRTTPAATGSVAAGGSSTGSAANTGTSATTRPAPGNTLVHLSSGVSGNRIADIDVPTRITAFAPKKLIYEIAINDANLGTVPATFLSTFQTKVNAAVAANPALANNGIAVMTGLCIGELFNASGNAWGLNPKDAAVDAINTQLATLAANNPGVVNYIDTRANLGAWLQAHGPVAGAGGNASGLITYDQFHPTILGRVLMGTWVRSQITVVP